MQQNVIHTKHINFLWYLL